MGPPSFKHFNSPSYTFNHLKSPIVFPFITLTIHDLGVIQSDGQIRESSGYQLAQIALEYEAVSRASEYVSVFFIIRLSPGANDEKKCLLLLAPRAALPPSLKLLPPPRLWRTGRRTGRGLG